MIPLNINIYPQNNFRLKSSETSLKTKLQHNENYGKIPYKIKEIKMNKCTPTRDNVAEVKVEVSIGYQMLERLRYASERINSFQIRIESQLRPIMMPFEELPTTKVTDVAYRVYPSYFNEMRSVLESIEHDSNLIEDYLDRIAIY
jgi:hypothetical protein